MTDIREQSTVNTPKQASTDGSAARGHAVAVRFLAHLKDQSQSLLRYLVNIAEMDQAGRTAFRTEVNKVRKEMQAQVKETEGTAEHDVWKSTCRSAGVRISEALGFSKAIDAGCPIRIKGNELFDDEGRKLGYHFAVKYAVAYNESHAQGPTVKRGRKAKPAADKLLHYVSETLRISVAEAVAILEAAQASVDAQGGEDAPV